MDTKQDIQKVLESLSPNEKKIIPFLNENNIENISKKSDLSKVAVLRAIEFLANKDIVKTTQKQEKIVELGLNGILYVKNCLPERILINLIADKKSVSLEQAKKESKLEDNEFKAALGVLKKKALINLLNGNILFSGTKQEISEKTLEEQFLDKLPKKFSELKDEEKYALENLKNRKNIIDIQDKKEIEFSITNLGREILKQDLSSDMIETITPNMIKTGSWKGKKFRRYDIQSPVPKIYGGKKHFVNQATEYAKRIWLEMGFKEMTGTMAVSSFWNFDALFTAQDHPVREMQDTFFIKDKIAKLPDKKIVNEIKKAHQGEIEGSKGWQYLWTEEDAKRVVLRTHTTCISAQTLKRITENKEFPAKYFALGKCFRNETLDMNHLFELTQTEGIVIDENANFRQLIGYLKEFYKKMGYEKIRVRPSYFPYTEPSLEIDVYDKAQEKWMELGGAGMFRPEVTIPIFGKHIPVLAWGQGFERIIRNFFKIADLRDMYGNDINQLRQIKSWDK
jgi:phenylalanyl-tRNA synthetase alpha chain